MKERLWKFLNEDGRPCYGGQGRWSLPKDGQPGEWMPAIQGELRPCKRGYHACRDQDLPWWCGPALYRLEARGEVQTTKDKVVCREARLLSRVETWNERTARLFACDCAERVLWIYEAQYPNDDRPRRAIEVARRYALGEATIDKLIAARIHASLAVLCAVNPAGHAAYAARSAAEDDDNAAWASVGEAAYAAGAAVYENAAEYAWVYEQWWQTERLLWYLEGGAVKERSVATRTFCDRCGRESKSLNVLNWSCSPKTPGANPNTPTPVSEEMEFCSECLALILKQINQRVPLGRLQHEARRLSTET